MSSHPPVSYPVPACLPTWVTVCAPVELPEQTTHMWRINLDHWGRHISLLWPLLSSDEQTRADRFVREIDRKRFVITRGILRYLLGGYLAIAPSSISFNYTPLGKPILAPSPTPFSKTPLLQFNVSHSHHLGLYAFRHRQRVGIDLEQLRTVPILQLAQRFFQAGEAEYLRSLPPEQQALQFFQLWTLKEAYLKATGRGLGGLNEVEVQDDLATHQRFLRVSAEDNGENTWSFTQFSPAEGFVAALAIAHSRHQIIWHDLSNPFA